MNRFGSMSKQRKVIRGEAKVLHYSFSLFLNLILSSLIGYVR